MSLSGLLARQFSKKVQNKGRAYYFANAVKIERAEDDHVAATVIGTAPYTVDLQLKQHAIAASCSCPFVLSFLEPCKHIWATILKADAQHALPAAQAAQALRFRLVMDDEDGSNPRARVDANGRPVPRLRQAPRSRRSGRGTRRARTPDWTEQLAEVRRFAMPATLLESIGPGHQLLYVVEIPGDHVRDNLSLDLLARERKKNGDWGRAKPYVVRSEEVSGLADPLDREILAALLGATQVNPYGSFGFYGNGAGRFTLKGPLLETMLPRMGATGRLGLRSAHSRDEPVPATWDDGPPWALALDVTRGDSGKQYVLTGSLRRGEERRSLSGLQLLVPGAVAWDNRIARLDDQGAFAWIMLLRRNGPLLVPKRDKDRLVAELLALPNLPRLELPEEMRFEEVTLPPRPRLIIKPSTARGFRDLLEAQLTFVYGEKTVSASPRQRGFYDAEAHRMYVRDLPAEQAAEQQLGLRRRTDDGYRDDVFELSPRHLPKVVRGLVEAGWLVEAEGSLYRKPGEFKLNVQSGIDWFDVQASVDFEGRTASLPSLLAALRKGEATVQLDDGTLGVLPEEWLKKYGFLAKMGTVEDDKVRFSRAQVGLLDALLANQPTVTLDQTFIKLRDELRGFAGIAPGEPPPEFVGQLRNYQREGLGWLHFLERFGFGGCLADDMGLGKTIQVLALLAGRRAAAAAERLGPALVVVPRSLIFNWKQEAARFVPSLKILDHTGLGRTKTTDVFDAHDLILTTYGTLRRDILLFKDYAFDYCILDESQAIKNANSEAAKAVRLLRGRHRLALSGTPVENHLGELWSLFEYLNPGMLGQASVFQLGAGQRNPDADTRALLARALRPFVLRRTKEQVAPELPAKTEQTLYCDMEPPQRKLYDELRAHYREALLGRMDAEALRRSKIQVLEALLRLRQAACHPGLIDKARRDEGSAKLDTLLPHLREVAGGEGHKALVFSQFTSLLAIVRTYLDAESVPYEYLDGRTRDRASRVERFQNDPECKLFLISLKAGGVGLNLTAAEYVYLLDPWWNPAVEAQAIDRTHRIGQESPVFAYRLIARDTVEEKVLELQKTKRALADAIIGADNSLIRDLKREDLELLLS